MGHHGLRDHVRRLPPARWTRCGSSGPAKGLHRRRRRLHRRVARLRARAGRGDADRGPCSAGIGRGDHLARGALDCDDELRGGPGAQQGARDLGRSRRQRRGRRRPGGRCPDQVPRLGVDLLRQRPRRRDRAGVGAEGRAREPRRYRGQKLRSVRRGVRDIAGSRCSSTRSPRRPTSAGGRRGRSSCWSRPAVSSLRFSSTSGVSAAR